MFHVTFGGKAEICQNVVPRLDTYIQNNVKAFCSSALKKIRKKLPNYCTGVLAVATACEAQRNLRTTVRGLAHLNTSTMLMLCNVSDPKSWCAVIGAPIRGEDATLSCAITYHNLGDARRLNPGAEMTAVVSWEAAAGTPGSPSTTATDSGATVQVNVVTTQTTGTEIPSFKCTLDIQFENRSSVDYIYALNSLSWDCVSAATLTWCEYCVLLLLTAVLHLDFVAYYKN